MTKRLGEVAAMLEVSNQTVKNWVDEFPDYFSDSAKRTTGKRYDSEDITTLKRIKEYRDQGRLYEEIADLLPLRVLSDDPEEDTEQPTNALQTKETTDLIRDLLSASQHQHEREIAAKDETIEILRQQVEDLKRRLPWWKR